ncbi:hypothetical protein SASPL_112488 [Salvia splendens]|uniref:Cis-zeatin O-glucosyltransferase n=1 Tax=Salvia splendens TaxID=180675 RepID=A0A8X9A3B5_SALSN|nr:hypothetical protein SASPL_112488 [Salvia splendens]
MSLGQGRSSTHLKSIEAAYIECLDKQKPRSVIFVSFGNTVTLSDEETIELGQGLIQSGVKFLWVLRDADKCDVFDGDKCWAYVCLRFGILAASLNSDVGTLASPPSPPPLLPPAGGSVLVAWSCAAAVGAIASPEYHGGCGDRGVADALRSAHKCGAGCGTGVEVMEWKDREEVVRAGMVESVVRRLMASEEGERNRKKAEELGAAVRELRVQLDSFIAHITR